MRMFERLRRLVLALSGAHAETLELLPTEWVKFESLGWAILITSGMATVSMWFALSSAMGVNGIIAVLPAALWGLVIMGIDRWLITSMPIDGKRKPAIAVPRFLLAVLLGTLISTPLVLRVFQTEINAQISVIKQDRYSSFLAQQQKSKVAQQVTNFGNQLAYLHKVVDSHGAAALNPAADPQVQAFSTQLVKWLTLEHSYFEQWQCQLYGGAGCTKKGNGPLAQASEASYLQAKGQVTKIQGEIGQRDAQLASNSKTDETARYSQAVTALPGAQQQYDVALARQNALQANFYAQNQATNGILIRLQALSQLSAGDFTVTAARFLLFLLFLVIECLPVTVKLLQRPGLYEEALRAARESELRYAEKFYRTQSRIWADGLPAGHATAVLQLHVEPEVDVRPIWDQTIALPWALGDPEDEQATEVLHYPDPGQRQEPQRDPGLEQTRPDNPRQGEIRHEDVYPAEPERDRRLTGSHEAPSVHQALSEMDDDRVSANSDGYGGVPLRWDEE